MVKMCFKKIKCVKIAMFKAKKKKKNLSSSFSQGLPSFLSLSLSLSLPSEIQRMKLGKLANGGVRNRTSQA